MASMFTKFGSLDSYLWGHPKTFVYAAAVDNKEALHHHTVDASNTIHNYPGISEWMMWCMMRHVEACTESRKGYFEHLLLMYSLSYNSQIKCFSHKLIWSFFLFWYVDFVPKVFLHLSVTSAYLRYP
jgi:hypothetical protein